MSQANGTNEAIKARQEERERNREHEHKQRLQSAAFNADGQLSREYIESLTDVSKLQDETIEHLQSLLSRSWALSNLTGAQEWDARMKLEVMKLKLFGMHPPEQSFVTGDLRAFLMDDKTENLEPLSQVERSTIDAIFEGLKANITTGREGFQQEKLNEQIAVSRDESDDSDDADDSWGLF